MCSDKVTLNFIEDYRCYPVLWDTSDKFYTNKNKRNDAYEALGKKYNMSVKCVKTKIKNLRSYFSKEQQKMLVKKSGAGADEKYETPWFAYKSLEFIGDTLTPRFTKDSMQAEILPTAEDRDFEENLMVSKYTIIVTEDNFYLNSKHILQKTQKHFFLLVH
jgi:hypothetical protein